MQGLHSYSAVILRRLNAIIHGLTRDGVVEKIAVSKKNRKLTGKGRGQVESVTTLHGLKLIDPSKLHQRESRCDDLSKVPKLTRLELSQIEPRRKRHERSSAATFRGG